MEAKHHTLYRTTIVIIKINIECHINYRLVMRNWKMRFPHQVHNIQKIIS